MLQASYAEHSKRPCWDFVNTALKAAINHIIAVLQPLALKPRVEDALPLKKNYLMNDFFEFSACLAEQAKICQSFHQLRSYRASQKDVHGKTTEQPNKNPGAPAPSTSGTPEKKKAGKLPPCLHPVGSGDFSKTSDDPKKNLLGEHRSEKSPGDFGAYRQRDRDGAESPHDSAIGQARRDTGRTPWPQFRLSHRLWC